MTRRRLRDPPRQGSRQPCSEVDKGQERSYTARVGGATPEDGEAYSGSGYDDGEHDRTPEQP